jgi:hypothetical protein
MVAGGTVLTFDAQGVAGGWVPATEDAVRSDLVEQLGRSFVVESVTVTGQGSFYELLEWPFVARIVVQTHEAYADVADVRSIVAHAIYEATGNMPTVGNVGSQGAIGSGGFFGSIADAIRGVGDSVGDAVGGATRPITQEFNFVLIAVAAVAIILIVNVGGKTTRVGLT